MTTFDEHRNLALGTVSAGSTVIDSATGDTIVAGSDAEAAEFPAVPFYATLWRDQTPTRPAVEIVRATAFDGVRTFTVLRAQQGTAAQAFVTQGWKFANTITAADVVAIEDAVTSGEAGLAAETAARESADTALQGDISAEATARAAGDAATLSGAEAYADGKVSAEASARAAGDAATLAAAEGYSDSHVAAEAAARVAGDAATLASAEGYADGEVAAEAATRASGDAATLASSEGYADGKVTTEALARAAGDSATLASAETYADAGDAAGKAYTDGKIVSVANLDEVFSTSGPKTIAGTAEVPFPVFAAPFPLRITGIRLISTSDVATSDSNYWIVMARRRRSLLPVVPYSDLVLADAPFAYWRFDELVGAASALDYGSGGHPLAYSATPPTLQQPSLVRMASDTSALFVRASNTYAEAAAYAWDFSSNQVTIEAFVKTNILGVGASERSSIFWRPVAGNPSLEIGGGNGRVGAFSMSVPGQNFFESDNYAALPGNVYDFVYRRSAFVGGVATEDIFINGVKQTTVFRNSQQAFAAGTTTTSVGRRPSGGTPANQLFDGQIDDLSVYNVALSDARIQAHADAGAVQAEISRKKTKTIGSGGEGFIAWKPWTFGGSDFSSYAQMLDQGDVMMLSFYPVGTPGPLTDLVVEVSYEAL